MSHEDLKRLWYDVDERLNSNNKLNVAIVYSVNRLWISELINEIIPYCNEIRRFPVSLAPDLADNGRLSEFTDKIVEYESNKYLGGISLYDSLPSKNEPDLSSFNRYLRRFNPDVVIVADNIDSGFISIKPEIPLWHTEFGEQNALGIFETLYGRDVTVCSLYCTQMGQCRLIASHWYQTALYHSAVNISVMLLKNKSLIVQSVKRLCTGDLTYGETAEIKKRETDVNIAYLRLLYLRESIKEKLSNLLYRDQWFLLYCRTDMDIWDMNSYVPYPVPQGRCWSQPCCITVQGREYVFFQDYDYKQGMGHISMLLCGEDGEFEYTDNVFQKPYHISYPFVFQIDDELFMIPESRASRTVDIYKCDRFPDQWSHCRTLLKDISAVDTTLLYSDGMWWIFTCVCSHYFESCTDELHIFYTDDILKGDIKKHRENPVIRDCRIARPGGCFIAENNKFYRISQDCSGINGHGLNVMEIRELSDNSYSESMTKRIAPAGPVGERVRTVAVGGSYAFTDGCRRQFKLSDKERNVLGK